MPQVKTARCRSCDASVVWMKTINDKAIQVDVDSVDEADLEWTSGRFGPVPVFDSKIGHISHFATCPDRDSWRKS